MYKNVVSKEKLIIHHEENESRSQLESVSVSERSLDKLLLLLVENNNERMAKVYSFSSPKGQFLKGKYVEIVFKFCQELDMPREIYYLTVELFECFMQSHVAEMYNYVIENFPREKRKQEWDKILARIAHQMILRIASCIQLASKFVSTYEHLNCYQMIALLRRYGLKFKADGIVQSELRVFKGLGFNVMRTTPLIYVHTLINKLSFNKRLKIDIEKYTLYSYDVLDYAMIERELIYNSFAVELSNSQVNSRSERIAIHAIERDYMFLASGVIATTSFLIDQSLTDDVIGSLNDITGISVRHLVDLTSIMLKPFALASPSTAAVTSSTAAATATMTSSAVTRVSAAAATRLSSSSEVIGCSSSEVIGCSSSEVISCSSYEVTKSSVVIGCSSYEVISCSSS
ncbi:hypothetical protein HELRODRAFT_194962 [Helobdella robusta]|uniref:Cyclin N-terminal domain-containing protein n=1 Tax=Helobdella robusta TaxID=6412 RepID=T1FWL9_HELRO|nr:hypothetical protein HELRODRAFT_194962 [Helobdella robusta]ESO10289.1 hypothetical protein HELRODRAFT_194962 [Helobdella robusta]